MLNQQPIDIQLQKHLYQLIDEMERLTIVEKKQNYIDTITKDGEQSLKMVLQPVVKTRYSMKMFRKKLAQHFERMGTDDHRRPVFWFQSAGIYGILNNNNDNTVDVIVIKHFK